MRAQSNRMRRADSSGFLNLQATGSDTGTVTFRPHISRARVVLEQCFLGSLITVANPEQLSVGRWGLEYVYQTVGYMRGVLESGC
jgi:hypothetical protein